MNENLLRGQLVRLTGLDDVEKMAKMYTRWSQDSEYVRLATTNAPRLYSAKKSKDWMEKELEKDNPTGFYFLIRTLEDDRVIGDIGLDGIQWSHGDTFVGIGIGEREAWGKGYGTDAMRIILRFAFTELNLHRVSLNTFEYNPRAIRSYEKAGFRHEGWVRDYILRDGKRYGILYMGILRTEWEEQNSG